MGIGSHDDGNGIADSPCYQNDGVAQLNAEGNVAVPQVMNANICIAQPIDGVKILPGKNYTAESLEAAHNEKG